MRVSRSAAIQELSEHSAAEKTSRQYMCYWLRTWLLHGLAQPGRWWEVGAKWGTERWVEFG